MIVRAIKATAFMSSALLIVAASGVAGFAQKPAPTYMATIVDPGGNQLGTAVFVGVDNGVLIRVDVRGLTPGKHGMHIHENAACRPSTDAQGNTVNFGAAGGHFDPQGTMHHLGPYGPGHAGDLPNLVVSAVGHARMTYFDDRVSVMSGPTNIVGRSIVIHANEDNYTDTPPLGGSGGRIACGEIGLPQGPIPQ